jgi:hypothetical protein
MKRAWDPVTLTRHWWHGPEPVCGDGLVTPTGRRYVILDVNRKRLFCMVLPAGAPRLAMPELRAGARAGRENVPGAEAD